MNNPVVFRRVAQVEFEDAAEWYNQRRSGLGIRFRDAVQRVIDQISISPDIYPEVYLNIREALISGYPYCVYYQIESERVIVLSVFHTSRDPTGWQSRI